jgi:hypothetical protein
MMNKNTESRHCGELLLMVPGGWEEEMRRGSERPDDKSFDASG